MSHIIESSEFFMPTKIVQGINCLVNNSSCLRKLGNKALIVTGKESSKLNGSLEDCICALENEDIKYKIFDEVEQNPSIETIEKAISQYKKENIEFILAVGGGSAIDAAKAIGVLFKNPNTNARDVFNLKNLKSLPIAAVPTTSGTGSEVTQYSIITDHKLRTKKNFGQETFPKAAFLDPRYTLNLSIENTISTAFDAFSHLVESYLNTKANSLSDMIVEKGFELFATLKDSFHKNTLTLQDRDVLMRISMLAGIAIAQTGTSLPHMLGYALTYNKNLNHGIANASLYKGYLELFNDYPKLNKMLSILEFEDLNDFFLFLDERVTYSLELTEEEIKTYSENAIINQAKLKNHPFKVGKTEIENIYRNAIRHT